MGERSIEVLKSTTVSCEKIMKEGFRFDFPTAALAIHELIQA
jgi:NAD dependent epimerase/dehydratase family enzyme